MGKIAHELRIGLRIVYYREADRWVAHCLEMGVIGDGKTRKEATRSLGEAVANQIKFSIDHDNLGNLFMAAGVSDREFYDAG